MMHVRIRCFAVVLSAAVLAPFVVGCGSISTVTVTDAGRHAEPGRLAVLNFAWDPTQGGPDEVRANRPGVLIADAVSSRLTEIPGFKVVPRETVKRVATEQLINGTPLSELIRKGDLAEVSRLLDAEGLVVGDVENDDAWIGWVRQNQNIAFSCRCVDARTKQTLWTLSGQKVTGPYGPINPNDTLNLILNDAIPKLRAALGR